MTKISSFTKQIAFQAGLTDWYVERQVRKAQDVAKDLGLDFSKPVLAGYDMNGPMTATFDASLMPYMTAVRGILAVSRHDCPSVQKAIISGWDLRTLRYFRDQRMGIPDMHLVGEMGAVYEFGGKLYEPAPVPKQVAYDMKKSVITGAAERGLKIAVQGNLSSRVADFYIEADGADRGNLRNHFLVVDAPVETSDIYHALRDKTEFSYDGSVLEFEPTDSAIREIDDVLCGVHTLQSVRLKSRGNKIALWRDSKDDASKISDIESMEKFFKEVMPQGWKIDPNKDYCCDLIYVGDDVTLDKEHAANLLAQRAFAKGDKGDYVITNIGDKKGDAVNGENAMFFPQIGSPAEQYCADKGIPHVPVIHAGDYSLILAELTMQAIRQPKVSVAEGKARSE